MAMVDHGRGALRVLLIYSFFGAYHLARWRHWRKRATDLGWTPLALQMFHKPDLYNWRAMASMEDGLTNLGLGTGGRDNLRWGDAPRLVKALARLRPDVVVVNGWGRRDAVLAHLWCQWASVPRVVVSDSQQADFKRSRLKEASKQMILRGVGAAFVAGDPHRRYVRELGFSDSRIFEGCDVIDNAHFAPAKQRRATGGYRILTVARFSPEKNLLAAGRAFLRFCAERQGGEPWMWLIAGYGPQDADMRRLEKQSQGRIRLLGAREYAELPAVYANADLYWQPSLRDTWALPVNEAMASELPVLVSARCGCHEDLVSPATGWTFDPTSEDDMVLALKLAAERHGDWSAIGHAAAERIDQWGLGRFSDGLMQSVRRAAESRAPS